SSQFRVYIIDEVHMMTGAAFNALLKTLEEPPKHAIFILATTEAHKVPITIQSRCQRFDFRRLSAKDIARQLAKVADLEGILIEPAACEIIGNLADGAMRDGLSLLEKAKTINNEQLTINNVFDVLGVANSGEIYELVDSIIDKDMAKGLELVNKLASKNGDVNNVFNLIFAHFSNLAVCKFGASGILEVTELEKLQEQTTKTSGEFLVKAMQKCREMISVAKFSGLTKPLLESLVVELCI
ncbi:MAG: DNA polymerase III subunit gamma/tau, partial [Oscillospiraceae bacterium]|nr:DNA polymerase III subunit gamma/tau [Oscillospiraceae bacterium]